MRIVFALMLVVLLSACGTTDMVKLSMDIPAKTSFTFTDKRDFNQRMSRAPSEPDANKYYGDDAISPSVAQVFRAVLQRQSAALLSGKPVVLTEATVAVTDPEVHVDPNRVASASATVPGGFLVAPLALLMIHGIERTRSEKTVDVRIRGTVDGIEFGADAVDVYKGRVTEDNIRTTLMKAVEQAANNAAFMLAKK